MSKSQFRPVTITIPPKLLRLADEVAKEEGQTRSQLLREALHKYAWEKSWKRLQAYGAKKAREMELREEDIENIIDSVRK